MCKQKRWHSDTEWNKITYSKFLQMCFPLFALTLCTCGVWFGFVGFPHLVCNSPLTPTLSSDQLNQSMSGWKESVGENQWDELTLNGVLERKLGRCLRGSIVDGVCVCECVCGWRVMRPDQRDGKPSRLLTQTHQEEGGGKEVQMLGDREEECFVSVLQVWQLSLRCWCWPVLTGPRECLH